MRRTWTAALAGLIVGMLVATAIPTMAGNDDPIYLGQKNTARRITKVKIKNGIVFEATAANTPAATFKVASGDPIAVNSTSLVDNLNAGMYPLFREGLDQITPEPVDILINTHWHHDHTGLNADFVINEGTGSIIAHHRTGAFLAEEQYLEDPDTMFPALPPEAQPTDIVHVTKVLRRADEWIVLINTLPNTHSNTDLLVIFLKANVVHMGDVYFGNMFPFIDRSSGGSIDGMIRTCMLVLPLINGDTLVVPSHGPVGDRAALAAYTAMLITVRDRIQALVDQGLSEEEVVALQPLADLEEDWGWFFLDGNIFTTIVYRDLAG